MPYFRILSTTRTEFHNQVLTQIESLIRGEQNQIANFANVASVLIEKENIHWAGFYLVEDEQLVLGPFQGPTACTRIDYGKGVCGTSWKEKRMINVADVDQFPGHIACSAYSKSEIVVPIISNDEVVAVLDIDSDQMSNFDEEDEKFYIAVAKLLGE